MHGIAPGMWWEITRSTADTSGELFEAKVIEGALEVFLAGLSRRVAGVDPRCSPPLGSRQEA